MSTNIAFLRSPKPGALTAAIFKPPRSLFTTRAAVEEGILPGGGTALLYATNVLKSLKVENDDQRYGVDIVKRALTAPLKQIAQNSGHDGAVIAGKILESKDNSYGFDAQSGKFCDLVKAGIVDPTKVVERH